MDANQIREIAGNAIARMRAHYGPNVWDYVNAETRKGWVSRAIVVDFATIAPDTPARDVAAVVSAADDMIEGNEP